MFKKLFLYLFFLFCINLPVTADEKPPIYWLIWELHPEYILDGQYKGQGYADKFLQYFQANLPEYEHKIKPVNVRRWNIESQKANHCTPHVWGDFFPDTTVLSKPYTFTAPHVLIFDKRFEERFGPADSTLSLEALLQDDELKLMTLPVYVGNNQTHARYPVLHKYLQPYIGKKNLFEFTGSNNEINLKLLTRGTGDYAIGYPNSINAYKWIHGSEAEFISYRIKEHDFYKNIYVSCRDTQFGNEVIDKINSVLTPETLRTFLMYQEEWNGQDPQFRYTTIDALINKKPLENVLP